MKNPGWDKASKVVCWFRRMEYCWRRQRTAPIKIDTQKFSRPFNGKKIASLKAEAQFSSYSPFSP